MTCLILCTFLFKHFHCRKIYWISFVLNLFSWDVALGKKLTLNKQPFTILFWKWFVWYDLNKIDFAKNTELQTNVSEHWKEITYGVWRAEHLKVLPSWKHCKLWGICAERTKLVVTDFPVLTALQVNVPETIGIYRAVGSRPTARIVSKTDIQN